MSTRPREHAIEANCRCMRDGCMRLLCAVSINGKTVFLEPETHADGLYTLAGSEFLKIVPNEHPEGRYVVRAAIVGNRMRFRDHEAHCAQKQITHEAMAKTQPTGVFNRDPKQ